MKPEFSKLVLGTAVVIWVAGAVFGAVIVNRTEQYLGELLTYIGAPTATSFGFYAWKAKNENIVKYNKSQVEKLKQLGGENTETGDDHAIG